MTDGGLLSVLLVSYNSGEELDECIAAALAQDDGGFSGVEVVVADNGSVDDSIARAEAFGDRVRVVPLGRNTGYAAGVNAAYGASRGDWVMLLNPDAVMDPGCAAALRTHLEGDPGVVVAAALLRDPDGTPQMFARRDPTVASIFWLFTDAGQFLDERYRRSAALRNRRYEAEWPQLQRGPLVVDCPAAACVLMRRADCPSPLLDERFPLFFNDAALYDHLRRGGTRRVEITPSATAEHGYSVSVRRVDEARIRAEWVVGLRRYFGGSRSLPASVGVWLVLLFDAVHGAIRVATRRGDEHTPGLVRGTLGGLGLPGGVSPWLTDPPGPGWIRRAAARRS